MLFLSEANRIKRGSKVNFATESFVAGQRVLGQRNAASRKATGQFLTSPPVARYMADQLGDFPSKFSILDPAVGSGVLLCAIIDRLIEEGIGVEATIDAYEIDPVLIEIASAVLDRARLEAERHGITIEVRLHCEDYVWASLAQQQSLFMQPPQTYDYIVANPPYFKLNADDRRVKSSRALVGTQPNIYALFMALTTQHLSSSGKSVFLVPRSFCSGAYFAQFREMFAQQVVFERVHLFESRGQNFDDVLQENIIITFSPQRGTLPHRTHIDISTGQNSADMEASDVHSVPTPLVLHRRDQDLFYRLPTDVHDELILRAFDTWVGSLHHYGMEVSTGRVVAFRAEKYLHMTAGEGAIPLLWMQHVRGGDVHHPLPTLRKAQWLRVVPETVGLQIATANYVLLRRFSAKEEARRLVAGAFLGAEFSFATVGFENHLNYIYRPNGQLSVIETLGLTALYNSTLFDRYIRITNGNTQVNAGELRALSLPPLAVIQSIGAAFAANPLSDMDSLVLGQLFEAGLISQALRIVEKI